MNRLSLILVLAICSVASASPAEEFGLFGSLPKTEAPTDLFCVSSSPSTGVETEYRAPYYPPNSTDWTWPGYPNIEALRRHLLTEKANHGDVNGIAANREAIAVMSASELRALHDSDHEYRLDVSRVADITQGARDPVSTTSTIPQPSYSSSCPSGNCPTGGGGNRVFLPRLLRRW